MKRIYKSCWSHKPCNTEFDSRGPLQNIIKDYCLLAALEYITNLWKENVNRWVRIPLIVQSKILLLVITTLNKYSTFN